MTIEIQNGFSLGSKKKNRTKSLLHRNVMQQRLSKNAGLEEKSVILVLNQVKVKRKSSITKSRTFVNRHRWQ